MKALCWHSPKDIRCDDVPDPKIEHPRDAIIKVTSCAICGSDLHLYDGYMPGMENGDVMGHEFMGEVVEVGADSKHALKVGDRVVIPFTIICGECDQCQRGNFSVCERSNRNRDIADKMFGHATAGLFGYTHLTGGYPGGQAEYVRVPYADKTHIKIPSTGLSDEQVLFLGSDRLAGGCAVRHSAHGHCRGLGLRAGRTDDDSQRDPAGGAADHRHRQCSGAPHDGTSRWRHRDQLCGGQRHRAPQRPYRWQGPGKVHRRRRHGGPCRRLRRLIGPMSCAR